MQPQQSGRSSTLEQYDDRYFVQALGKIPVQPYNAPRDRYVMQENEQLVQVLPDMFHHNQTMARQNAYYYSPTESALRNSLYPTQPILYYAPAARR